MTETLVLPNVKNMTLCYGYSYGTGESAKGNVTVFDADELTRQHLRESLGLWHLYFPEINKTIKNVLITDIEMQTHDSGIIGTYEYEFTLHFRVTGIKDSTPELELLK